ncbi:MAG: ATP-binding protein [Alphaproteobacteria bacterium]
MTVNSLSFRLAAGAALWITVALVVAGFGLSGLFRDHVERGFDRQILLQLDRLAAVSEVAPGDAVKLKRLLADPRFEQPYSGWYWQVAGSSGPLRRSRSLWDQVLEIKTDAIASDKPQRFTARGPGGQLLWGLRRNLVLPGSGDVFQISVAADVSELHEAIEDFNETLALSLAVLGIGLLAAVIVQVRYGLSPLRRLRDALAAVRSGRATQLVGRFPDEVTPLARELNALLDHNARVIERARTHVGNLAHALKTPLTVIGNAAAGEQGGFAETARQQVATMSDLVNHHLTRARTVAAAGVLGARTDVSVVTEELRRTLARIYAERGVTVTVEGGAGLVFLGESQDLQEMLGNLMDNACKWARDEVRVTLEGAGDRLHLCIEDDGPGLAPEARARVFDRGRRLDEAVPGNGLGLAIVRDVAELYGGSIDLSASPLGGLRATLDLPAAAARG